MWATRMGPLGGRPSGVSTRDQREEGIKSGSLCSWLPPSVSPWAATSLSPRSHLFSRWPSSHNVLVLDPSTCSIISIFLTHITACCPVLFLVISLPLAHTSTNNSFTKPSWNYPKPCMPSVSSWDPD